MNATMIDPPFELPAKYAYEFSKKNKEEWTPWSQLPDATRQYWRGLAQAAVEAHPGPISFEVHARLPGTCPPLLRHFACDMSLSSISAVSERLRTWLEDISHSYRPPVYVGGYVSSTKLPDEDNED